MQIKFLLLMLAVLLGSLLGACRETTTHQYFPEKPQEKTGSLSLVIPEGHAYSGAYIDFGDHEDHVTLEGIEQFDKLVHQKQAIIAFSNDWGNQNFPEQQLNIIDNYGAVPLVFWSPWDRPEQGWDSTPGRFDLNSIIAGKWDDYIDRWATRAKEHGKPLFVSWGLEMNGRWFPWSGIFYGAGKPLEGCKNCFEGPETYKSAYRHIVDRVRAKGAVNILWAWHVNNTSDPDEPWNSMAQYYPGPQYVDWLAMTAYGAQFAGMDTWFTFDEVVRIRYKTLSQLDESKPIMLAEWGIGEFPEKGSKARWIAEFFERISKDCPRIHAAVFWHERWQNGDQSISNLRVNSSAEALEAYRTGISDPFWLSRPVLRSTKNPG